MVGFFRSLKRLVTGEVVRKIDIETLNGRCTVSVRLKREVGSGDKYVTIASLSSGSSFYMTFDSQEYNQFAEAVSIIQRDLPLSFSSTRS